MKIKKDIVDKIVAHAKKDAPLEACGYLARQGDIVAKHYGLTNIDKAQDHFAFDPKEQFQAVRDARSRGFEVCALYHSHPHSPARPSAEDIKLAHDPNLSHVIISLANSISDVKAYKIKSSAVEREDLEIIEDD